MLRGPLREKFPGSGHDYLGRICAQHCAGGEMFPRAEPENCHGEKVSGGYLGNSQPHVSCLSKKFQDWAGGVRAMAEVARKHPRPHMRACRSPSNRSGTLCSTSLRD